MPKSSEELTVTIVGGAIAGCAVAALLKDIDGITVKVIENSKQLYEQSAGTGIGFSEVLFKECIKQKLFDADIRHTLINRRSFWVTDPSGELRNIWQQPMNLVALNWKTLFDNLRRRVPSENYHAGQKVHKVVDAGGHVIIGSSLGEEKCDLLIAADGVNSAIRKQIYPTSKADYAGVVATRGIILESDVKIPEQFKKNFHYFFFPGGHLLIFPIIGPAGEVLINWMLYEIYPEKELEKLLVDNAGKPHSISLPQGSLRKDHIEHLHALANKVLPPQIAAIVTKTKEPFLQVLFTALVPTFVNGNGNICFSGDAGMTTLPQAGFGASNALAFAISLADALKTRASLPLNKVLQLWDRGRHTYAREQVKLSINLCDALIRKAPDWWKMKQKGGDEWFEKAKAGIPWHVTDSAKDQESETPNTLFFLTLKTAASVEQKPSDANSLLIRSRL